MLDFYCLVATLLMVASRVVMFVTFAMYRQRDHWDFHAMKDFQIAYLQQEWETRHDMRYVTIATGVLNALAWLCLAIPLLQVVWIQVHATTATANSSSTSTPPNGRSYHLLGVHAAMVIFIIGGALTEFLSNLLVIGANETAVWLASGGFNLDHWIVPTAESTETYDMIGWRTLEVVHWVIRGMLVWIDAAEWLFLSFIFMGLYVSVWQTPNTTPNFAFSKRWAVLGFLLGLVCMIDFTANVLRLKDWKVFSIMAAALSLISSVTLMPIWLLWLGRQLYRAESYQPSDSNGFKAATTTTVDPTTSDTPGGTSSTDEDGEIVEMS